MNPAPFNEASFREFLDAFDYYDEPPRSIIMSRETFLAFRKVLSRFRTKQNRSRAKRRRRAIGRGRW